MGVSGRFLFMSLKGFGSNKVMRIGQANIDFDALTIHGPEGQFSMESKGFTRSEYCQIYFD